MLYEEEDTCHMRRRIHVSKSQVRASPCAFAAHPYSQYNHTPHARVHTHTHTRSLSLSLITHVSLRPCSLRACVRACVHASESACVHACMHACVCLYVCFWHACTRLSVCVLLRVSLRLCMFVCVRTVLEYSDPGVVQGDLNPWITNAVSDSSLRGPRIALPSCSVRETEETWGLRVLLVLCK
jgi:hypothetical protein